ncbi:hypothetical protein BT69DRAFT_681611 [Atractiella rhizophila]|nr:hypothetical protein BT69DRAFT_681611 [Atractiella rhizophila]
MKDGPMKQLIQDIRNQVISPAFVPLLDAMGINFYDGCLLVEIVQDLDSSSPSTSSSSLDDPSSSHPNEAESEQLPTLSSTSAPTAPKGQIHPAPATVQAPRLHFSFRPSRHCQCAHDRRSSTLRPSEAETGTGPRLHLLPDTASRPHASPLRSRDGA